MSKLNANWDEPELFASIGGRSRLRATSLAGLGAVVGGVALALATSGTPTGATSLNAALGAQGTSSGATLADLERAVAVRPDAKNVAALASAYLDRNQPGLAQAVLESSPLSVRESPAIQHLEARARLRRGRARSALAFARIANATCESTEAPERCPVHLAVRAARHLGFLEELVSAGIEDPEADPVAARAAFDRSDRNAGWIALR